MIFDSFLDGNNVNLLVAYFAGFITFFASCLLPLVPTYLAYLSGVALNSKDAGKDRFQIIKVSIFFVIGFISTFILLSLTINILSQFFSFIREAIGIIGGFVFIILGLFMLGVFKHRLFSQERRLDIGKIFSKKSFRGFEIDKFFSKYKNFHALVTGIIFGFGWSPCIGPVLAVILFWSSRTGSALTGILLLIVYGLGLGTPFILVAIGFEKIIPLLKRYSKISLYISYLSGIMIIIAGVLMIAGFFHPLSIYLINLLHLRALSV